MSRFKSSKYLNFNAFRSPSGMKRVFGSFSRSKAEAFLARVMEGWRGHRKGCVPMIDPPGGVPVFSYRFGPRRFYVVVPKGMEVKL